MTSREDEKPHSFRVVLAFGNLPEFHCSGKFLCVVHSLRQQHLQYLKLTVVLVYYEAMETYSRIAPLGCYGNLQSYWTTTKLWKLTVVLDYYEAMEIYSRIALLRIYGNLRSYGTTKKPLKLTVVLVY